MGSSKSKSDSAIPQFTPAIVEYLARGTCIMPDISQSHRLKRCVTLIMHLPLNGPHYRYSFEFDLDADLNELTTTLGCWFPHVYDLRKSFEYRTYTLYPFSENNKKMQRDTVAFLTFALLYFTYMKCIQMHTLCHAAMEDLDGLTTSGFMPLYLAVKKMNLHRLDQFVNAVEDVPPTVTQWLKSIRRCLHRQAPAPYLQHNVVFASELGMTIMELFAKAIHASELSSRHFSPRPVYEPLADMKFLDVKMLIQHRLCTAEYARVYRFKERARYIDRYNFSGVEAHFMFVHYMTSHVLEVMEKYLNPGFIMTGFHGWWIPFSHGYFVPGKGRCWLPELRAPIPRKWKEFQMEEEDQEE